MARFGSVAECASEHGVVASTVRRWIRDGVVSAQRVGERRWRVDLDSVTRERLLPPNPRRDELARVLSIVSNDDAEALRDLARRMDSMLGDALTFSSVWDLVGAVALAEVRREERRVAA